MVSSIEENRPNDLNIELFPNPSNGLFNLIVEGMNDQKTVEVFDQRGALIYKINIENRDNVHEVIDLSNQASGLYLIRISGSSVVTKRLIKT